MPLAHTEREVRAIVPTVVRIAELFNEFTDHQMFELSHSYASVSWMNIDRAAVSGRLICALTKETRYFFFTTNRLGPAKSKSCATWFVSTSMVKRTAPLHERQAGNSSPRITTTG